MEDFINPHTVTTLVILGLAAAILWVNLRKRKSRPEVEKSRSSLSIAPVPAAPEPPAPKPVEQPRVSPASVGVASTPVSVEPPAVVPPVVAPSPIAPSPQKAEPVPPAAQPEAARSIFISYRRQDSQHITGRIYDRLTSQFGKEAVFKDVDSIPLGYDFRDHLRDQVGQCAVLVAVIGKSWNPPAASGERRLSDPRDHLRIEIESALERRIPVIPVLVDGAEVPPEDELPSSLGKLAYHNGIAVRPDPDFHHDADRLTRGIEMLFKQGPR